VIGSWLGKLQNASVGRTVARGPSLRRWFTWACSLGGTSASASHSWRWRHGPLLLVRQGGGVGLRLVVAIGFVLLGIGELLRQN
jgi:hypothetical protein